MSRLYLKRRLSIVALLFVLAQGAGASDLKRILYGTTASPSHLPVWVAKDAGLFEKNGLDVEPVQIRGGSLITLAIITGNLPFSGAGAESVVAARAAGGDVVLLACPVDADPVYLITRPEIKSAQDLKGQASAVTRYGSTTHFYLRAALKHVGLNPDKDMTILQMGAGPEMVTALDRGASVGQLSARSNSWASSATIVVQSAGDAGRVACATSAPRSSNHAADAPSNDGAGSSPYASSSVRCNT